MPHIRLLLLLSFSLACSRNPKPDVQPASSGPSLPAGVTMAMVTLGDSLFNAGSCQRCHGPKGVGGRNGPSLVTGAWIHSRGTFDDIARTITTGVPKAAVRDTTRRFAMNPRGGPMNLTDDQVRAVAGYVWGISRGKQ